MIVPTVPAFLQVSNNCRTLAICEVTTTTRHQSKNTEKTRVSTTCAILMISTRSIEDKIRKNFEQNVRRLLKSVSPEPIDPKNLTRSRRKGLVDH